MKIISYSEFLNNNFEQLSKNYKDRRKHIFKTYFYEYCQFIYVGMKINAWLPAEYTNGIIIKESK